MRLILVRHGDPDYAHDCLTELGHRQAAATAERLAREGISRIFASPMGRARQTAGYTAEKLELPVTVLDFMHEISWGNESGDDITRVGHPWTVGDRMIAEEDWDYASSPWRMHPAFRANRSNDFVDMIAKKSDEWLAGLGYVREGTRYRCTQRNDETIALFAHGGSGACLLTRLLNLPFPYVCSVLPYGMTSLTIMSFQGEPDGFLFPRLELYNDMAHLQGIMSCPAPAGN